MVLDARCWMLDPPTHPTKPQATQIGSPTHHQRDFVDSVGRLSPLMKDHEYVILNEPGE
jgi:hypothetical protein